MVIQTIDEALEEQAQEAKDSKKSKPKRIYEGMKEEEFVQLLENTKKQSHRLAFVLAYGSGLRLSEIVSLKPEDVDLKANKIFIRQSKGSKDRVVNVPKWFRDKDLKILPLNVSGRAIESAFLRTTKKIGINSIIGNYETSKGKQMPLYKYRVHSLRHSFAVRALEKGVPVNMLQAILGHENLATTNRYTHVNAQDAIQAILDKGV